MAKILCVLRGLCGVRRGTSMSSAPTLVVSLVDFAMHSKYIFETSVTFLARDLESVLPAGLTSSV